MNHIDGVVIMAGTNDLWLRAAAHDIFGGLQKAYDEVLAYGAFVVAVTIPETYESDLNDVRNAVNKEVRHYVAQKRQRSDQIALFDAQQAFPHTGIRNDLWSESVHFSHKGYDALGDRIFDVLKENFLR